jgi:hypothetical protein
LEEELIRQSRIGVPSYPGLVPERSCHVIVNVDLLAEVVALNARDRATARTAVEEDCLLDLFVADFVAESESLEGHDTDASEVLDAARALVTAQ